MYIEKKEEPRVFSVGHNNAIKLYDQGSIYLESNEQVTFKTEKGAETDFVRKNWGFYAAGSLNGRLLQHNLRAALLVNSSKKYYIMFVECDFEKQFLDYILKENNKLICWLDCSSLSKIENLFLV